MTEKYKNNNRVKISKETQLEFGLKDEEIPARMKDVIPKDYNYTNFID